MKPMTLEEARNVYPRMWTVYDHPTDYPNNWVVRLFWGLFMEEHVWVFDELHEAHFMIQQAGGCVRIPRSPGDSPSIYEVWL